MTGLPPLAPDDFPAVFEAIHGTAPYAWQRRLLAEVVGAGVWPAGIAAPTGAGKTAVVDIALFHLALSAGVPKREAPMRIVLAVDRRVIVDQAFDRACRIAEALAGPGDGPLAAMRDRLAAFSGGAPLHVAELRGGLPRETDWARRVDQPTILCTTVDQLGSRLLFRGYGVSDSMAPVHAGLLGVDALLILDEAHLSLAFAQTLAAIGRARAAEASLGLPWGFVALTATPRAGGATFALTDEERAEDAIRRRLAASKPVTLRELAPSGAGADDDSAALARDCADRALELAGKLSDEGLAAPTGAGADDDSAALARNYACRALELAGKLSDEGLAAPTVAVVVNRVALARAVFGALRCHLGEAADVLLLTGRVRPAERDALVARWRPRLEGRAQGADRPLFVVATQCIEAGADFDFDAMVTQIAPLDALRQRFGRLARSGNRRHADGRPIFAPGAICAARSELRRGGMDPIYGSAPAATWDWLVAAAPRSGREGPTLDFGPDALDQLLARTPPPADCFAPSPAAPPLRQADLEAFAMTAPRPHPDPSPALFLHGAFRDEAEIAMIWRADIGGLAARAAAEGEDGAAERAGLAALLAHLPPRPAEALRLPLWTARAWIAGAAAGAGADALADVPAPTPDADHTPGNGLCLVWRGGEVMAVQPDRLRPGDVVVFASERGGCDSFGWAPDSRESVRDIADAAAKPFAGRRAALRLHPAVWPEDAAPWSTIADLLARDAGAAEIAAATGLPGWAGARGLALLFPYGPDPAAGALLVAAGGLPGAEAGAVAAATEDDAGLSAAAPVSLTDHAAAVARLACAQARALGLSDLLTEGLARAALWHDDGKADPRFQLWLRLVAGLPDTAQPLAKTILRSGPARLAALRSEARLPGRWRHEVASVRLAATRMAGGVDGTDPDLVLWLVGSHHGQGRPFFAHDDDWDGFALELCGLPVPPSPGPDKLDFDWMGRDWTGLMRDLQARCGVWGLAFLEACLRLADHRASAGDTPAGS